MLNDSDDEGEQEIVGSLVIDGGHGSDEVGARVRWVILAPECHGLGIAAN